LDAESAIAPEEWLARYFEFLGGPPSAYLVIDVETTGGSYRDTLATQLGFALAEDSAVIASEDLIADWTTLPGVGRTWFYDRLERTARAMAHTGKAYATPPHVMRKHGIPWDEAMDAFYDILDLAADQDLYFVGHNAWAFDRPILDRLFALLPEGRQFSFDRIHLIDTGLIEKAMTHGLSFPTPAYTSLGQWNNAIQHIGNKGKWNLHGHCAEKYSIAVDHALAHASAAYDCRVAAALLECYKDIACRDTSNIKTRPRSPRP